MWIYFRRLHFLPSFFPHFFSLSIQWRVRLYHWCNFIVFSFWREKLNWHLYKNVQFELPQRTIQRLIMEEQHDDRVNFMAHILALKEAHLFHTQNGRTCFMRILRVFRCNAIRKILGHQVFWDVRVRARSFKCNSRKNLMSICWLQIN